MADPHHPGRAGYLAQAVAQNRSQEHRSGLPLDQGRDHSELLWVVGNASRFNAEGAVPTNTTRRNVLRRADENDWHTGEAIYLLSSLAALMHDLGKACQAFQDRLRPGAPRERNLYRHEWISLRLFQSFVGNSSDTEWLQRLIAPTPEDDVSWISRLQRDGIDAAASAPSARCRRWRVPSAGLS